ncbi:MAG: UDP-N-acetylmuramoyl-tripeptide--D-alanyl-D-alanine ligase [Actinophytocola sp.]|uniref:UDP-N-acetylmuramoyl-tripeptide--D-alanyl-D- alanine ligase n=1 Tax=Actinophytocola sp. TaxID=1872138 RepID=UPI00132B4DE6|nr:UDP-N-acetylmuramoyl-tripeptide--D-alanyl-D-alanine ligase [Actinophytocola sp.]MPZ86006.1 UDP-N-acetylmuramoyl-tripeptide--D-alanyl-D-alanine ligase [Actinophytocola sp.]
MIPLTLSEVAEATGGRLHNSDGSELVTGSVEFDSRQVGPGGLFVALPGDRVDGHDFAATAVERGAVGVLAARPVNAPAVVVPPVTDAHVRSVALTGDSDGSGAAVLAGLARLARDVVDRLAPRGLTVVGVTGSSGKTSTKDLIAQVLEPTGATVAPPGSFNNELGHPWTVLRADADTRHLVLELSARGPGHIRALCETAPPRIGVVLNVGTAHLGEFGSQEDIAATKGELAESLPAAERGGVAILNADDPLVRAMAERTTARVVLVGESEDAQVRAADVELDDHARATFTLVTPRGTRTVTLGLHGGHHVGNALAAAAVGLELGAGLDAIAERLRGARRLSARRMEVSTRADDVTVVNDAYNANPESVGAALRTLARMAGSEEGRGRRRTWAVLGVMGELGDSGAEAHEQIGRLAMRLHIDRLVAVDEQAGGIQHGARLEGTTGATPSSRSGYWEEPVLVPDVEAAVALLNAELRPGDVVLVKASKVAALWRVADAILGARA